MKAEFGRFDKAIFDKAVADADMRTAFTEYAWDMGLVRSVRERATVAGIRAETRCL